MAIADKQHNPQTISIKAVKVYSSLERIPTCSEFIIFGYQKGNSKWVLMVFSAVKKL